MFSLSFYWGNRGYQMRHSTSSHTHTHHLPASGSCNSGFFPATGEHPLCQERPILFFVHLILYVFIYNEDCSRNFPISHLSPTATTRLNRRKPSLNPLQPVPYFSLLFYSKTSIYTYYTQFLSRSLWTSLSRFYSHWRKQSSSQGHEWPPYSKSNGQISILILLDLSATFVTFDLILLEIFPSLSFHLIFLLPC